MRFRKMRLQRDCALNCSDRFAELARFAVRFAEIGMSGCILRICRDGPENQVDGEIMPAGLMSDYSEQVQRIRVAGTNGENLAVEWLRFGKASSLVVLEGQIQHLLDGDPRHIRYPSRKSGGKATYFPRCR